MAGAAGPQLQIHGERISGQDVRTQNTTAVMAVANILKTSLGPVGLDKVSFKYLSRHKVCAFRLITRLTDAGR